MVNICATTSVASRLRGSVRVVGLAAGAVVTSGILAISLVAVPPNLGDTRTEFTSPRLIVATSPLIRSTVDPGVKLVVNQRQSGAVSAPKTPPTPPTPRDVLNAAALVVDEPAVASVALAATATESIAQVFWGLIGPFVANPILGPIVLFAPIILLVVLACPPCALFNFLTFTIPSFFIPFAPLSAVSLASTLEEEAVVVERAEVVESKDPPTGEFARSKTYVDAPGDEVTGDVSEPTEVTGPDMTDVEGASSTQVTGAQSEPPAVKDDTDLTTDSADDTTKIADDATETVMKDDTATTKKGDVETTKSRDSDSASESLGDTGKPKTKKDADAPSAGAPSSGDASNGDPSGGDGGQS